MCGEVVVGRVEDSELDEWYIGFVGRPIRAESRGSVRRQRLWALADSGLSILISAIE